MMYKRGILDLQSALFASSPAGATDISLLAGDLGEIWQNCRDSNQSYLIHRYRHAFTCQMAGD